MNNDIEPDLEATLSAGLDAAASKVNPTTRWDDLTDRIEARHRRQRRSLIAGAAVVALLGSTGGYAFGNRGNGNPITVASGDGDASTGKGAPERTDDSTSSTGLTTAIPAMSGPYGIGFNGVPTPSEQVFARDFGTNGRIRVWRQTYGLEGSVASEGTPPGCTPIANLTIELSDPDMVSLGSSSQAAAGRAVSTLLVAGNGGPRAFAVVVVTGLGATPVRATFPRGSSDEATAVDGSAVNGIAALATTIDATDMSRLAAVRVSIDGGAPAEVDQASIYDSTGRPVLERHLDCTPRLPDPGEQPADPTAAKAAVVKAYSTVLDGTRPFAEKAPFLDDATGVELASKVTAESWPAAVTASRFELVDLVFTDEQHAALKFDVIVPDGAVPSDMLKGRIGLATLVDGVWKVSRSTMCALLSMGGGQCDLPDGRYPTEPGVTVGPAYPAVPGMVPTTTALALPNNVPGATPNG